MVLFAIRWPPPIVSLASGQRLEPVAQPISPGAAGSLVLKAKGVSRHTFGSSSHERTPPERGGAYLAPHLATGERPSGPAGVIGLSADARPAGAVTTGRAPARILSLVPLFQLCR